eukprot:COSAG01_NODE_2985_length_6752_cov_133.017736_15_plen_45_part_01
MWEFQGGEFIPAGPPGPAPPAPACCQLLLAACGGCAEPSAANRPP